MKLVHGALLGVAAGLITGLGACSGGGDDGGGGGLPTGNLTVTVRVELLGRPAANAAVWISGHGPFITDAIGQVVVTGMPSPYRAVIVLGASGTVDVWDALTTPTPVFECGLNSPEPATQFVADIAGTVTGGLPLPVPLDHETNVYFTSPDAVALFADDADRTTGDYSLGNAGWIGPLTINAELIAVQALIDLDGYVVSYDGFGTLPIPNLGVSDTLTNQDIALAPVATAMVTGNVSVPPGMAVFVNFLQFRTATSGPALIASQFVPGSSVIAVPEPTVPGAVRDLVTMTENIVSAALVAVRTPDLPTPATNIDVVVPEGTGSVLPIDDAVGVGYDTLFMATPNPGDRVITFRFVPAGAGPELRFHTLDSMCTIPNLTDLGISIPPGAAYDWSVTMSGPATTLDDAAIALTVVYPTFAFLGDGVAFYGRGGTRSFTFEE